MWTFRGPESRRRTGSRQVAAVLACLLCLAGCESVGNTISDAYDSKLPLDQPEDWWHQLQGGMIAQQRPPPPGATDPYPNLDLVPPRPTPTDAVTRHRLLAQLAAQRDLARQTVAQQPIVWPVPGAPTPPQPAQAQPATPQPAAAAPAPAAGAKPAPAAAPAATPNPAAPPADTGMTATFAAADAPAKPVAPPPTPAPDPSPPAAFTAPPPRLASAPPVPVGAIPTLPTAAPPLPELPGIPAATTAPATPRPLPSASFVFARGSDVLPPAAETALRHLVSMRAGAATIAVSAGGEAVSASPDAQAAALPLALRRVGAITATLIAAGVPPAALRSNAAALGRDGSARLVD